MLTSQSRGLGVCCTLRGLLLAARTTGCGCVASCVCVWVVGTCTLFSGFIWGGACSLWLLGFCDLSWVGCTLKWFLHRCGTCCGERVPATKSRIHAATSV
ncbi:hypothetical protein C8Q74DRAFT_692285 [Fomes fomentarius]|nr:hypothetical protein C8Q74DRAFT_692285 [Fomes fomentarius]